MKEDRDKIDDLFRSKLYDFDSEALPDDVWEKIEGRLGKPSYSLPAASRRTWWSAAAAIALLVLSGTVYFLRQEPVDPVLVQQIEQKTEETKSILQEQQPVLTVPEPIPNVIAQVREEKEPAVQRQIAPTKTAKNIIQPIEKETVETTAGADDVQQMENKYTTSDSETADITGLATDEFGAASLQENEPEKKKEKVKRWSFGMGAGSFTAGSNDAANMYAFRNTTFESPHLDFLNSYSDEIPKTDIKHRQPISVGLSASYMLTPRWYLMAGVSYSYLSSEWRTNGTYNAKTEQHLHFVGLPVSLAYKIAEWNNFMWYASAGFKPEVNVAGTLKVSNYANDQMLGKPVKENQRMKQWYWSVNAGTGVSYPLWRYLNAFAEVGAGYYFDNGSSIETIHSDKPFNVNLSFGLRLGF